MFGLVILLAYLFGVLFGVFVNFWITFEFPKEYNGVIVLASQTAGLVTGLAVHMCLWLFMYTKSKGWMIFSVIFAIALLYASLISYSRIGWISCAMGFLAWSAVYINRCIKRRNLVGILTPLACIGILVLISDQFVVHISQIADLILFKSENTGKLSNEIRMAFGWGVLELILTNPFGVSYSGFFDAFIQTEAIRSFLDHEIESVGLNPHSSILVYASAGGFIGIVCILMFYYSWARQILIGLKGLDGSVGVFCALCFIISGIVTGLADPAILSQLYLIFPAAFISGMRYRFAGANRWDNPGNELVNLIPSPLRNSHSKEF
jgi:hypothetical protein